jgi:hypothetical protein
MENANEVAQDEAGLICCWHRSNAHEFSFAQTRRHVSYVNQSAVNAPIPGYQSTGTAPIPGYQSAVTAPIPGYDKDGGVVGIANPDQPY